jgi:hypothetical protein
MSIPNEDSQRDYYDPINQTSANSPYNEDWDMDPSGVHAPEEES